MKRKIKHDKELHNRKLFLLSGHENNVLNILTTLDAFDPHVPKYGSAVIIELHANLAGDYTVRVSKRLNLLLKKLLYSFIFM